jgi:hypothetical protein
MPRRSVRVQRCLVLPSSLAVSLLYSAGPGPGTALPPGGAGGAVVRGGFGSIADGQDATRETNGGTGDLGKGKGVVT